MQTQPSTANGAVNGAVIHLGASPLGAREADLLVLESCSAIESNESELDDSGHEGSRRLIKAELAQGCIQFRRGELMERTRREILAPMGSPGLASETAPDVPAASADGLSAFRRPSSYQLSLSAWFPAAFLTTGVALLLEFRSTKSASIVDAVAKLTAHPVQVLVIMIPLLVIATVVTQAFSFEAIRFLEGYWGRRGVMNAIGKLMIRRHMHRKKAIAKRKSRESANAFRAAMPAMIIDSPDLTGRVAKAIEAQLSGEASESPSLKDNELPIFVHTIQNWRDHADAWRLARIDL